MPDHENTSFRATNFHEKGEKKGKGKKLCLSEWYVFDCFSVDENEDTAVIPQFLSECLSIRRLYPKQKRGNFENSL